MMSSTQPTIPPTPEFIDLAGKIVIVTGANSGVGFETVRQYLLFGAKKVILAVRTLSKGLHANTLLQECPEIQKVNPQAETVVMELDLDSYESVKHFVNEVNKTLDRLDILLLNAGLLSWDFKIGASGHDRVMQVNFYSNALLALALAPLLRRTAAKTGEASRLSWVGSYGQELHSLNKNPIGPLEGILEHFDNRSKYRARERYGDSKLLASIFTHELARRVPRKEIIVNTVCPGLVLTDLHRHLRFCMRVFMIFFRKLQGARSAQDGARALFFATSVAGPETHGRFLSHNQIVTPGPVCCTLEVREVAQRLWDEVLVEAYKADSNQQEFIGRDPIEEI